MKNLYILDGHIPIAVDDAHVWGEWMECNKYAFWKLDADNTNDPTLVGSTHVNEHIWVSTVFLGIDHSFFAGPPILFETMVFHDGAGEEEWRYATWDEAVAGHEQVVRWLADGGEKP